VQSLSLSLSDPSRNGQDVYITFAIYQKSKERRRDAVHYTVNIASLLNWFSLFFSLSVFLSWMVSEIN